MTSRRVWIVALLLAAAAFLAGCANDSPAKSQAVRSAGSAAAQASSVTADPDKAACDAAHATMLDVKATIGGWNGDLLDVITADKLRTEATALFGEEVLATGSTKAAIDNMATTLTKFSIQLGGTGDPTAVGETADAANAATAQLRGVCGF